MQPSVRNECHGLTRRILLAGAGALAVGAGYGWPRTGWSTGAREFAPAPEPVQERSVDLRLVARERPTVLPCFDGRTLPLWTFADDTWLPIVRIRLGERLKVTLENRLPRDSEHTSIHWHGIRLPNDQDGVPYLVQPPVLPGEDYDYNFVPPDAGTFWFHTHCNTAEQLGRGLAGLLIVGGDESEPYAADETILLRDWRVDLEEGGFAAFSTSRGSNRAGTYGTVRSANGAKNPVVRLPSAADCRIRLVNTDPTRLIEVALEGAEAAVIAIDGVSVLPFPLDTWMIGPGMRIDLAVRAPGEARTAQLVDRRSSEPEAMASLVGTGPAANTRSFDPEPLRAGRVPEPDLDAADVMRFDFGPPDGTPPVVSSGTDGLFIGSLCLSSKSFWSINGQSWPGRDHTSIPPPLARLELGRSYLFKLRNTSKLIHPIHIHGHTFKVLRSNQRKIPPHNADTVLLMPDETVDAAFVADNPGRWMFHCHVIEHQEAGMMGYVEVA